MAAVGARGSSPPFCFGLFARDLNGTPDEDAFRREGPIVSKADGIIFDIKRFAIHDGPGIRTTVFFKGCSLACRWCHNPEGQRPEPEPVAAACGSDGRHGTVGRRVTAGEVLSEIEKDGLFFDESGGGATFSGGEPLLQPDFLEALVGGCRTLSLHTVLDTSGFAPAESLERVMDKVDLFHYDFKFAVDAAHRRFTGVPLRPVLDNLLRISRAARPYVVRFPFVPGITDPPENLRGLADAISSLPHPPLRIDVLPFHHYHRGKYTRLGRKDPMGSAAAADRATAEPVAAFFRRCGFPVGIGGSP